MKVPPRPGGTWPAWLTDGLDQRRFNRWLATDKLRCSFQGRAARRLTCGRPWSGRRPDLLELALEEVGSDLFERAADGTRWAQPAIYCAALAGARELDVDADVMAGHSLGEITALVAAGALGAEDGLRLVAARGAPHAGGRRGDRRRRHDRRARA